MTHRFGAPFSLALRAPPYRRISMSYVALLIECLSKPVPEYCTSFENGMRAYAWLMRALGLATRQLP